MTSTCVVRVIVIAVVFIAVCGKPVMKKQTHLLRQDISSQVKCHEIQRGPTDNCAWAAGLNYFADMLIEHGQIISYKIQWKSGQWSDWFIPGINDLDKGYNSEAAKCSMLPYRKNSLRRMWSFFTDHSHIYVICRPKEDVDMMYQ